MCESVVDACRKALDDGRSRERSEYHRALSNALYDSRPQRGRSNPDSSGKAPGVEAVVDSGDISRTIVPQIALQDAVDIASLTVLVEVDQVAAEADLRKGAG